MQRCCWWQGGLRSTAAGWVLALAGSTRAPWCLGAYTSTRELAQPHLHLGGLKAPDTRNFDRSKQELMARSSRPRRRGQVPRHVWKDGWNLGQLLPLPVRRVHIAKLLAQLVHARPGAHQCCQERRRPAHTAAKSHTHTRIVTQPGQARPGQARARQGKPWTRQAKPSQPSQDKTRQNKPSQAK